MSAAFAAKTLPFLAVLRYPLSATLYEVLAGTAFDSESEGTLIAKHEEVFECLSAVRSALGITRNMHCISLLNITFQDMQDRDILACRGESVSLLRKHAQILASMLASSARGAKVAGIPGSDPECQYRVAVLSKIAQYCHDGFEVRRCLSSWFRCHCAKD